MAYPINTFQAADTASHHIGRRPSSQEEGVWQGIINIPTTPMFLTWKYSLSRVYGHHLTAVSLPSQRM